MHVFAFITNKFIHEIWYSRGDEYEYYCLLGCDIILFDGKVPTFLEEIVVYTYGRKGFWRCK